MKYSAMDIWYGVIFFLSLILYWLTLAAYSELLAISVMMVGSILVGLWWYGQYGD